MKRSLYYVLRWEGDGYNDDPLYTTRSLEVRHAGEAATRAEIREAFQSDTDNGSYAAGRYRIYPADAVLDVSVRSVVVDPRDEGAPPSEEVPF